MTTHQQLTPFLTISVAEEIINKLSRERVMEILNHHYQVYEVFDDWTFNPETRSEHRVGRLDIKVVTDWSIAETDVTLIAQ